MSLGEIVIRSPRTRRAMLGALAMGAPTALLVACGASTSSSAPAQPAAGSNASSAAKSNTTAATAPTTAAQPAAQSAQTGTTKTLPPATIGWDTFRGGPDGAWANKMVETFQAKYPNIKVDYRAIALDNGSQQSAYPKMYAMAAAGTLGDVFAWDPSHWVFYQAIKRNVIKPVDSYIAADKFDMGQFYKPFVDYQKWEGKTWGLPSWGWTGHDGLLYNDEMAQQAGLKFPAATSSDWNFTTLYDLVVKMGKFAEKSQGFGMATTMPSAISVTIFSRAFDSDNLSPDGKKSLLLDAKVKEAMRWIYDLSTKERVVALPGSFEGSADDLFANGKVGFHQAGSLGVFTINKKNTDGHLKFKATLFPKRKDGKRPSQLRGGTWNTGTASKYPDHGWEFIKHITNREGMLLFNTIGGQGALTRPDIMNDDYFKDPNFRVFLENFENSMVHVVPANFRGTEYEGAFGKFGTPWYKGEVGYEDGLTQWNTELQTILDKPAE